MITDELRIGNLLARKRDGIIIDVKEVLTNRISYVNPDLTRIKSIAADLNAFQGIELSEYWLLKFGFENHGYDFLFFTKDHFDVVGFDNSFCWNWKNLQTEVHSQIEIKYVHQLQNLFYALTGTELLTTPQKKD